MEQGDQFLVNAAKRADFDPNGLLDVVAHGTELTVELTSRTGKKVEVNHRVLAALLQRDPAFRNQPIRLLSCNTGKLPNGLAQNLANKLGVVVYAPDEFLWAYPDGRLAVGKGVQVGKNLVPVLPHAGTWRVFVPGGNVP